MSAALCVYRNNSLILQPQGKKSKRTPFPPPRKLPPFGPPIPLGNSVSFRASVGRVWMFFGTIQCT